MKREKDTAVRCVYIALRWSAVASARFSIDILLRWSKEILGGVGSSHTRGVICL